MKATLHLLIFFSLNSLVFSQPANDSCSNAENIALTTSNQTISFSINDAVLNNEVGCDGTTAQSYADIWYEFTMPVNGNLRINGQISWNRFAVYDACGGNEIACFSSSGFADNLQEGNSYLLRVFRTASLAGNTGFQSFGIMAIESPDNETCATAENLALSTSNQSIDFSISGAEINNEEGCAGTSNTDLLDVWYEFTMPVSGNIIINGQIAWNQFSIYDACNGNEIACFSGSSVVDGMVGGDTYLLRVYRTPALAFNLNFQEFDIQAFEAIDNDTCVDATNISVDTDISTVNFDIKGADVNNEVGCEGTSSSDYLDAWFEFTMPVNGNLNINGQIAWNQFAIYDSCGGNEIACFSGSGLVEGLEAGITYQLRVFRTLNTALNSGFQSFTTQAFEVVANDDCSGAENIALDTQQQNIDFYITGAEINTEVGCEGTAPQNYVDVWYSFEMPFSGDVFINGQISWNNFAVYESCGGNEVHSSNTSALVQALDAGETYFLRVFRTETNATNTGFQNFNIQAFENTTNCASISIWDGSTWSNGIPDATTKAVINDDFDISTDIEWCELEIVNGKVNLLEDAKLTLNDTENSLYINTDGELEVKGILSSVGDIQIEGKLIFKSDDTSTGQLDKFNAAIIGDVTVERYIPARRAFRFLSSSLTTSTSINANWQEGQNNTGLTYPEDNQNSNPGFGTHISGSQTGANGFDATASGNPSLFMFNNATQTWQAVTNTDLNTITSGHPYRLMVRGNRDINLNFNSSTPTNTIIRTTGNLNVSSSPSIAFSSVAGKFNFFGNPYQAAVDMTQVLNASTNINTEYYYVWDPLLSERGTYVTIDLEDGSSSPSSNANQYLQPGQAAFVTTLNNGASSITFEESHKAVEQPLTQVFSINSSIQLHLYRATAYAQNEKPADAIKIKLNEHESNTVNSSDALKMDNLDENLALINNSILLSIESRAFPLGEEYVPLFMNNYKTDQYVFEIQLTEMHGFSVQLIDHFMDNVFSFDNDENNTYSFQVDSSIPESIAYNRFELVLNQEELNTENTILANALVAFPNPVRERLSIQTQYLSNEVVEVKITNMTGKKILNQRKLVDNKGQITMDMTQVQSGLYLVEVFHAQKGNFSTKVIKK